MTDFCINGHILRRKFNRKTDLHGTCAALSPVKASLIDQNGNVMLQQLLHEQSACAHCSLSCHKRVIFRLTSRNADSISYVCNENLNKYSFQCVKLFSNDVKVSLHWHKMRHSTDIQDDHRETGCFFSFFVARVPFNNRKTCIRTDLCYIWYITDCCIYFSVCLMRLRNTKNKQQKLHICTTGFLINLWSFLLFEFAY